MATEMWKRSWSEPDKNPLFSKHQMWYMLIETACQEKAKVLGLKFVRLTNVPKVFNEDTLYLINLGTRIDIVNVEQGVPKVAQVIPE